MNADVYASIGQGFTGYNMYAYCGNNPVNRSDYSGQFWSEICNFAKEAVNQIGQAFKAASPAYAGMAAGSLVDGPLPFADIVMTVGAGVLSIGTIAYGTYQATKSSSKSKTATKDVAIPNISDTVIYRYGYDSINKLVPTEADLKSNTGLSFSTVPRKGAAMTTINTINLTGVLIVVKDGKSHVSVYPVGGTIEEWHYSGSDSIWTQVLASIVIKWG